MKRSSKDKVATFFPTARKECRMIANGTGPLVNKAGERRIQLSIAMNLSDGKLVGMPDWIAIPYEMVAKISNGVDKPKSLVQLDGVNVEIYTTPQTAEPTIKLDSCTLRAFVIQRAGKEKANGELADVELHFVLYSSGWVPALWKWIGDNLNATFFALFSGTQMSLSFGKPKSEDEEIETEEVDPKPSDRPIIVKPKQTPVKEAQTKRISIRRRRRNARKWIGFKSFSGEGWSLCAVKPA